MAPVERDELGEVENLSLFEKYPEAFKRLSILFGGLFVIVVVVYWFTTRETSADCGGQSVPVLEEEICHADMFCIQRLTSNICTELWAEKKPGGAAIGILVSPHPENLGGFADPEYLVLSDAQSSRRLYQFELPSGGKPWKLGTDIIPQFGDQPIKYEDTVYLMPLPDNRGFRVIQAPDKLTDHAGMLENAIDFQTPSGTPVLAMRDGFVVGMRMDQTDGGPREDARGHANYIWIQHLDGSVATYMHLFKESNSVELGDTVIAGQQIALSGATGYVTEPMLHVHVSSPLPDGSGFKTYPLRFQTTEGNQTLQTFQIYRSRL